MTTGKTRHAESRAILVLGMHRSGTSALTRVLNLLGADISSNLMAPDKGNETGFWESTEIYQIHERLLASLGRTWFDVTPLPAGWSETSAADLAVQELAGLLRRDFASSRLWIVKDPRMCRLVPLWLRTLAVLGVSPVPVLVVRHPDEVAQSMYKMVGEHHKMPEGAAFARMLWMEHLLDAEKETRGLPRALVTYEELLKDWPVTMDRLGRELSLSWPRGIEAARGEIEAFLNTQQRHHVAAGDAHGDEVAPEKSDWSHRLYAACVDSGTAEAKWVRLKHLRKPYDDGMSVLGPGFAECLSHSTVELEKARTWGKQQSDQLASSGSQLYQARIQLHQRDAELTQVRAALDELNTQATEHNKALYEHRVQLQQRDAELAQVRNMLDEQNALVAERSKALYEHRMQLQQREAELAQVRSALDEQSALVAERSKELYERRLQLQQREAELQHQREALGELGAQMAKLEGKCVEYERAMASRQAALEALRDDNERLATQLSGLQARVASRRWLLGRLLLGERYKH